MTPKPILHTIDHGGSDYGIHYYKKQLGCQRKALLDEMHQSIGNSLEVDSVFTVGTIGHYFMELFFNQKAPKDICLQYTHGVAQESLAIAERVFSAFRNRFPDPTKFGKLVGTEIAFPKPKCAKKTRKRLENAVGISPFTGKIDLVTKLSEANVKWLKKTFNGDPDNIATMKGHTEELKPGYWLWDHKFLGGRYETEIDKALWEHQFVAYMLAWNALNPNRPCQGMIQNTIYKYKETKKRPWGPEFSLIVVPFPTQDKILSLHQLFALAVKRMTTEQGAPDPTKCIGFDICSHKLSRECRGY